MNTFEKYLGITLLIILLFILSYTFHCEYYGDYYGIEKTIDPLGVVTCQNYFNMLFPDAKKIDISKIDKTLSDRGKPMSEIILD
jgi:hypothetical protein